MIKRAIGSRQLFLTRTEIQAIEAVLVFSVNVPDVVIEKALPFSEEGDNLADGFLHHPEVRGGEANPEKGVIDISK